MIDIGVVAQGNAIFIFSSPAASILHSVGGFRNIIEEKVTATHNTVLAQHKNEQIKEIIRRTKVDSSYIYDADGLMEKKIRFLADNCNKVLDVGKSSRQRYNYFRSGQILTLDINQFDDYPDVVDDICNIQHIPYNSFDGIICMAVLEHVYEPHAAVKNLYAVLKDGGYCLLYTPFLYRYHAPNDLTYQDFFRYSRDALAYLLRDFSDVTLYPCLGRYSTALHLFGFWKHRGQKVFGQTLNRLIDKAGAAFSKDGNELQASGYYTWAIK